MLNYYYSKTENGFTYSVDNCRLEFMLSPDRVDDFTSYLHNLHFEDYPLNNGSFKFRYLSTARYDTDSSMTIGFSFNGTDRVYDKYKGFIDVNPNKVGHYPQFWKDLRLLRSCFATFEVKRIDLAVDMPFRRDSFLLEKDSRKYQLVYKSSSDSTEYLGMRSNVGFVKVYNKTIESKLAYDLTRLEITIEPSSASFFDHLPRLHNIDMPLQLGLDSISLTDTDRYILEAEYKLIINHLDDGLLQFKKLGRKKYEKLKPFLLPDSTLMTFSRSAVDSVISAFLADFK